MNVLDLFSGIGGFSLGLERAGMRTVAFCEIEPFCRAVLKKHWPTIPVHADIKNLTRGALKWVHSVGDIDVICGGFPCQDISIAGRGAGMEGDRSGLWSEYRRLIGELRPRYVIVENVSALLHRGLERVLGDLAALGYDAEWHCIPASAIGAPHRRDRIWIVGYPSSTTSQRDARSLPRTQAKVGGARSNDGHLRDRSCDASENVADAISIDWGWWASRFGWGQSSSANDPQECGRGYRSADVQWLIEPDVGRVANGVPARVDRLAALGNAIVPQIAEIIGRAIMSAENLRLTRGKHETREQ